MTTAAPTSTPPDARPDAAARLNLPALTGLRLVAAVAVYFSHIAAPAGAPEWLRNLQQSGYAGVTVFFVLSGFVLTLNYFDRLRTPDEIWRYVVARFARVYPLYLVVLAWPTVQQWAAGTLQKGQLFQHALGVQAWNPDVDVAYAFVGPAWSISVELFLYATLPLLVPLARLLDRRLVTLVGGIVLVVIVLAGLALFFEASGRGALPSTDPASSHRWLYRTPVVRLGDFLLGILAARVFLRLKDQAFGSRLGHWLVGAAIALTVLAATRTSMLLSTWSFDLVYAVPGTALILGLALSPRNLVGRVLALRTVVFLGEASFAFYLVHVTVIGFTGAGDWSTGVTPAGVVQEAMFLGLAMAVGIGLHVGVEKPARLTVTRLLVRRTRPADTARPTPPPPRPPVHAAASRHALGPLTEPLRLHPAVAPAPTSSGADGRPPVPTRHRAHARPVAKV